MDRKGKDFQDTFPMAESARLPDLAGQDQPRAPVQVARQPRPWPSGLQFLRDLLTYRFG